MSDTDPTLDDRPPSKRAKRESEGGQGVISVAVSGRLTDRQVRWAVGLLLAAATSFSGYSVVKVHSTANKVEKTDAVATQADQNAVATYNVTGGRAELQAQLITTLMDVLREVARGTKRCLPAAERRELQERLSELEKKAAPLVQKIQEPLPPTPEAAAAAAAIPPTPKESP